MLKIKPQKMKVFITIIAACLCFTQNITAQSGNNDDDDDEQTGNYNVSFITSPIMLNGPALGVGAKYKFLNVAQNVYAEVTILSATGGASVAILDDNTLTKPEAFSPQISVPANSNGLVEFKISYFKANGNVKRLDTLRATAMDIDGSGLIREVDALNLGAGATLSYFTSGLQINVVQAGNQYTATNIGGMEYTGVDTAAKQVMFTVTNKNITNFIYKAGVNNGNNFSITRQKGIYFKGFNYTVSTLPVKYLSFNANVVSKAVLLSWVTQKEINHSNFEVERSFTGKDFSTIGIVLDGLENGTDKEYSFKDNAAEIAEKEIVYYRLKQIDINGKFNYSNVITVRLKATNKTEIQVSPNPFTESIIARFNSNEKTMAQVKISNVSGQVVLTRNIIINKGFNNIQIDGLSNLPKSVYVATLTVNGKMIGSQQIIK